MERAEDGVANPKQLIKTEDDGFITEWVESLENEVYHANKECVGSSTLKRTNKSTANFKAFYTGQAKEKETEAMKWGTLVHKAILEPDNFLSGYVVQPEFSGQTKDGRESKQSGEAKKKKAEWYDSLPLGTEVVTAEELKNLEGITRSILEHDKARELLQNGKAEISGFYVDPDTNIKCRIRPDFMSFDLMALLDIKTCQDCSIDAFSKTIWNRRYDFQMAMYCFGAEQISKKHIEYPVFIAVEEDPPWELAVYTCDPTIMETGLRDYRACLSKLKNSIEKDSWLRYAQNEILSIGLPHFALKDV